MQPKLLKKAISTLIISAIIYPPSLFSSGIVVDPRSGTVTLDRAQNGVQVINIAAPNSRGLSHNRFVEFNVTRDGVILNNSGKNAVSVLGGALYTNPNMAGKTEASLILGEVTGVNRSNINGFTEVHGRKADYVLANPNGITCSGCGFINVNRVTLTTGRPEIENGFLKNLNVQGGDVTIGSAGVSAENLSYFEIISRTAKLQGQINANDLSVVAGRNDYDYQTKQVRAKVDNGDLKPELSIDATSLGSIYAGRIKLISTEAGVGVNVPNSIYADASDIIIDSNGDITYKNLTANTGLSLRADGKIKGLGSARTNGNIELNSDQLELVFGSELVSHNNITINSNDVVNTGSITSAYDLNMMGFSLLNSGELLSDGFANLTFTDFTNTGTILTTGVLNANGANFNNSGDVLSHSDINFGFAQALNSGQILSSNDLVFSGFSLNNSGEILGNNNVAVGFNDVVNSGDILAVNALVLDGQNITNNIGGELLSYNDLNIGFDNVYNFGSIIAANILNIDTPLLLNSGDITAYVDASIDAGQLNNTSNISSGENLNVNSDVVNNTGALISEHNITVNTDQITNAGSIASNEQFVLNATTFDNDGSILSSNIDINANIDNSNIIEGDYIWLTGNLINKNKINGWSLLDIETSSLNNENGELLAGVINKVDGKYVLPTFYGDLNLRYNGALTLKGKYFATGDMDISATGNIDNRTDLKSLYGLKLATTGTLTNRYGTIMAGISNHSEFSFNTYGTLDIDAANVVNRNVMYSTGLLEVDVAGNLDNYSVIFSKGTMDLQAGSRILNTNDSYLYSIGSMTLTTPTTGYIDNDLGIIKTESGNMNITTGTLYNESTLVGKRHPLYTYFPWLFPGTYDYINYTEYNGGWALPDDENVYNYWTMAYASAASDSEWSYISDGEYNPDAEVIEIGNVWKELGHQGVLQNLTTADYSVIRSGGNITMNLGSLYNTSSDILAAGNITINARNRIDNSRAGYTVYNLPTLYVKIQDGADAGGRFKFFYVQRDYSNLMEGNLSKETVWFADSCGFWGTCEHIDTYQYLLDNIIDMKINYTNQKIWSDRASRIIAGGNISLNKTLVGQDAKVEHTSSSSNFYTDISGTTSQSYNASNTQQSQLNAGLGGVMTSRNLSVSQNIEVDGVMFRYASGAGYLIESNPLFVDLNGLMSSNYFIERAGYNKDQFNMLFMGDAYWEKEYIAKQIEQEFNRKFIVDEVDSEALQREVLLTNALEISGDLKLKIGVGLTEAQRKSLKKSIVWYVTQDQIVNGKKVTALVPKVYSPITSDFAVQLAGGILSGNNIAINTDTDVQVGGIMYANGTTSVKARDFNLDTAQLSTGKLNVKLDRDLNVRSSNINVLDSALIDAGAAVNIEGTQKYERKLAEIEDGSSLLTKKISYIGSKLNVGKDLAVKTGGNFGVMGSDITVGGSASFDVGGDMLLASAEESTASERTKYDRGTWSSTLTKENHYTTTQKGSNLNVGKDLEINTAKSLTLISSDITADNAYIESKGDVNLLSKLDETNDSLSVVKSGMLSKKIDETTDYKGVNVGSSIKANNTNYIKAGGNINLVASELASDNGAVALEATDVNLLSANDVTGHSEYHKTINYFSLGSIFGSLGSFITGGDLEFGSFKEDTKVSSEEIAKGSSIRGPTVLIKTTNDLNSVGSNISGQDVGLDVGRDLNLLSAQQQADYFSDSKEGKLYLNWDLAGISGVSLKGGLKYTEQKESTKTTTNVGSTITADNLQIKTGRNMTMMGSDILTNNSDIDVAGNFKALDVQDTVEHNLENLDVRTGVELRLTSNPLSVVEGIAGLGKTLASGQMFSGINGAFGSFNDTLTNFGKINQGYDTGSDGHLNLTDGSFSLNLFMDVNKHTENTNTSTSIGSSITANNELKLTTGNDLLLYGSNINAGKADINVGNNLDIRSSFDTSKNDSSDVSMGMTMGLIGSNVGSPSIHGSGTVTSGSSKWVNSLAGIQTTNGANINVRGNTNLEGGLINDANSKLKLTTGSLTFKNLEGSEDSHTYGLGRSVDLDLGNENTNIKYASVDKDQIARATIGGGTINVVGQDVPLINGLNRDISKALEVTKDESTNLDIDIDDRLLSSKGRENIARTVRQGTNNLGSMADSLAKVVSDSGDGIHGLNDGVAYSEAKINVTKTIAQMADSNSTKDQEALAALSNPAEHSAEELQNATEYVMQKVASQYGYSQDELDQLRVIVYNDSSDKVAGFRQNDTTAIDGDIGLNASKTGLGTDGYYLVLGHEFGHFQQAKNAEDDTVALKEHDDSEAYSNTVGRAFLGSINDGLYVVGREDVNTRFWSSGLENSGDYLFTYGNNNAAASITNRDNYLETPFDMFSLGMGINSIRSWDSNTPLWQKTLDVGGVALDAIALATPVPGGFSLGVKGINTAVKAGNQVDTLVDASKTGEAILKSDLPDDIRMLAEANITDSGKTVLGHYGDVTGKGNYIDKAKNTGSSYFDLGDTYSSLSESQQKVANFHFLDKVAENGDDILLSVPKNQIKSGSSLEDEITYLVSEKGYKWVNQWALKKR